MEQPIYLDPEQPLEKRADDLLSRLTLEEKASQLLFNSAPVKRLGIKAYNWWSECLHGVARNGKAAVFPQAIGIAAAFDPELAERIAEAISDEARAKYNIALKKGWTDIFEGLTFWTPNINIFRDPRWGRGQETYGEDPYLTSETGKAFVRGLQGKDPDHLKTAACAKHYAVHSGPEKERHSLNVEISLKDLRETYLPAFESLVREGVESVMGAYNRLLGEPCCASELLIQKILRGEWNFQGHFVSDCGALDDFHKTHGFTENVLESVRIALSRGCDLNCGSTYSHILECVEQGLLDEKDIDRSLRRLLRTRFKLGMFDPAGSFPYSSLGNGELDSRIHRKLAFDSALKSVVLLKNRNGILPIKRKNIKIFVTGPNAADVNAMLGNYNGLSGRIATVLEGIVENGKPSFHIDYRKGCMHNTKNRNKSDWFMNEVRASDIVIAVMGLTPELEGEEGDAIASSELGDRSDIELPGDQIKFLKKIASAGKPVVLVLLGGSPISLGGAEALCESILFCWIPGEEGGNAIASIIYGDHTPGGKLPVTFPKSAGDLPPFNDYSMKGRTYRYMEKEPLFPFGFGLSYTSFEYISVSMNGGKCTVSLKNTGKTGGDEVVQLYISNPGAPEPRPLHSLCGFKRVYIGSGEEKEVDFSLDPGIFAIYENNGNKTHFPGKYILTAGGCSPGVRGIELGAPIHVFCEVNID
ncbi:MAG: glycoside hydrolase family 3 C-terminal domain-containing protein [Brevinematales bacterium]